MKSAKFGQKRLGIFMRGVALGGVVLATAATTGCSRVREDLLSKSKQGIEYGDSLLYPHAQQWGASHMSYMATQGTRPEACKACHNSSSFKAPQLNIGCGTGCHAQKQGPAIAFQPSQNYVLPRCSECHDDKFGQKFPHAPGAVGQCGLCHVVKDGHFEEGDSQFVVTAKGNASCLRCHESPEKTAKNVHPIVLDENGGCVSCHDPHGSENGFVLKAQGANLCLECHDVASQPGSTHQVISQGQACLQCHLPHASNLPKLVKQESQAQCLSCHSKSINTSTRTIPNIQEKLSPPVGSGASVHDAAAENCRSCHLPHSSQYAWLLSKKFPSGLYETYDPGLPGQPETNSYALCFQCHHDPGMLKKDITGSETGFRNGLDNLHYRHVTNLEVSTGGQFGRSCRTCHDPHGSVSGHLIHEKLPATGGALGYQSTADGGSCARSCHSAASYKR